MFSLIFYLHEGWKDPGPEGPKTFGSGTLLEAAYLGNTHLYELEPCDGVCGGESNLAGEQHPNGGWHHAQLHNIQQQPAH
jgi:hypothetical protein